MIAEELGEIRAEFQPGRDNLIAGLILGLLAIAGGCTLIYLAANGALQSGGNLPVWLPKGRKGWSWGAVAGISVMGVALAVGGILLLWWVKSLFSFGVRIGLNGMAVVDKRGMRVISWDDIASVQENHLYERPPILKGPAQFVLPKMLSKSFIVKTKQGEPLTFDGTTIKGHVELAALIKERLDGRSIPWEIVEMHG
jgi:hypothetical protein